MEYAAYLRDQADKYRELAKEAEDPAISEELMDLAAVCEQVAANIEANLPSG